MGNKNKVDFESIKKKIEFYNSIMAVPEQKEFFLKHMYNGVGSDAFFINPRDFIFKEAAKIHDFLYFVGGTEQDRVEADEIYNIYGKKAVYEKEGIKYTFYHAVHQVYTFVLRILGKKSFEYYPAAATTWEEVVQRYQRYIERKRNQ